MGLLNYVLDLVFPPRCEVCKKEGPEILCLQCLGQIKFMKPNLGINSVSLYAGALREALHRFKFQGKKRLAHPLGLLLINYISQLPHLALKDFDGIVPIPLHPRRRRQRGFNQAELLAGYLEKYFGTPVVAALERTRDTLPQFDLPREARVKNVAGAFKVSDHRLVYNKSLILFDDIYTTGSTMAECAKALKIAGAKKVEMLALSSAA